MFVPDSLPANADGSDAPSANASIDTFVAALDDWVGDLLLHPAGRGGFGIDRSQRIRGIGSLADVARYSAAGPTATGRRRTAPATSCGS